MGLYVGTICPYGDMEEENDGEIWQYMGTVQINGEYVHQFRHRCHPSINKRVYRNIPASCTFEGK